MLKDRKKQIVIAFLILFIALWISTLLFITPEEIVEKIGVHNTYLLVFMLAVVGGLSTVTGTSLFAVLATFANGGANPWILGLAGGIGIFLSDSVFFFLARQGVKTFEDKAGSLRDKITNWVNNKPKWFVKVLVYLYVGLTPLPNDILMIALALSRVSYKNIAVALFLGSITIATITSHLGGSLPI